MRESSTIEVRIDVLLEEVVARLVERSGLPEHVVRKTLAEADLGSIRTTLVLETPQVAAHG